MQLGMVGLGKMGAGMAKRLSSAGHDIVGYDQNGQTMSVAYADGINVVPSLNALVSTVTPPRVIWVMVPPGDPTDSVVSSLGQLMERDDVLIDGGNNYYKAAMRRGEELRLKGIHFVDVGVSGGIYGRTAGYSLMVGGPVEIVRHLDPVFQALAPAQGLGYGHVGPQGAGHFVKMVHNGVEYALMESYAEGFELLKAKDQFKLNLAQIARIWCDGSVIRSWLLGLTAAMLEENPELESIEPYVEDSGEGRWAVQESVELAVPVPAISIALQARFRSRQNDAFGLKVLAGMRGKFGGHRTRKAK